MFCMCFQGQKQLRVATEIEDRPRRCGVLTASYKHEHASNSLSRMAGNQIKIKNLNHLRHLKNFQILVEL